MAQSYVSVLSVMWEERVDKEIGISLPIVGRKAVHFSTCLRAIQENGLVQVELEAFGRRWSYKPMNACDTPLDWGIGRLILCMKCTNSRLQVVLEGVVAVHNVTKCRTLIGKELRFVPMSELPEGELLILGFGDPSFRGFTLDARTELGALVSDLTGAEEEAVLSQKEKE